MTLGSKIWPGLTGLRDQLAAAQADIVVLQEHMREEDWQDSVLSRALNTPPPFPAVGARYIVAAGGVGTWLDEDDNIAEFTEISSMVSAWIFTIPNKGFTLMVEDETAFYYFDGAVWGSWGGSINHNALINVTTDQHHAQVHILNGANHTVSGLTDGYALMATGATTFAFERLQHSDLGSVTATQHHDNANDPSTTQKNALVGSYGTPDTLNPYMTQTDPILVKTTTAVLHVYADGILGNDANTGLQYSAGTGGSFVFAAGTVTFTGTGAAWTVADIGRLITINYATSSANSGSFIIISVPAGNQVTYANANGVTEAFTKYWSVSSPKLTIGAAVALLPDFIKHNCCLHLSGTFTDIGRVAIGRYVTNDKVLLIDGGTALTIVADNTGTPWTPDIFSSSSIGLTTAGWTLDAYAGYFVEIVSGTCAGQTRMIQGNTIDTITPCRNFQTSPDATSVFRIVRPTTQIIGSPGDYESLLTLCNTGTDSISFIVIQNLYFSGDLWDAIEIQNSPAQVTLSHIVSDALYSFTFMQSGIIAMVGYKRNPVSFAVESSVTASQAGISCRTFDVTDPFTFYIRSCGQVFIQSSYITILGQNQTLRTPMNYGTRILCWVCLSSNCNTWPHLMITSNSGYATTRFGGLNFAPYNIPAIFCSEASLGFGVVDISNSPSHAIELVGPGHIHFGGVVTGTGNAGAGVYAHGGAHITLASGVTPTLTGAVGNLSVNGTTQATTWAAIAGGTPYSSGEEFVRAKVYTSPFGA